jgi:hypothetical protein
MVDLNAYLPSGGSWVRLGVADRISDSGAILGLASTYSALGLEVHRVILYPS